MDLTDLHSKKEFRGDKKDLIHFLVPYEKKFIEFALPRIPSWISTAHLTLMTLIWSAGIILSGYWANTDIRWLWLFSFCIFLQYVTDMLDGAVGRARNSGLIKWGFYMDHFLDYVFLSSIILGYSFMLPVSSLIWALVCLAIVGGFMVHVLMDFAITNNFKISFSYFGVSEVRWLLIIFNIILMVFGKGVLMAVLPFVSVISLIALCALVAKSQKFYGHIDTIRQSVEERAYPEDNTTIHQGDFHGTEVSKTTVR